LKFFGFYIDEKIFEYDELEYELINCLVDHHNYKQDIQHKYRDDEYKQDRKELNNYPKKIKYKDLCNLESCGTVPNPEKSRLSRPVGHTELSRKFFGTGQTGLGQFKIFRDGTNGIGTI
jgi:hypothetical protein